MKTSNIHFDEHAKLERNVKNPPGESSKLTFLQYIIPPFILSIITFLWYWPSLNYPFQFDDIANISKKFAIRFDNPLARWSHNRRWLGDWINTLNFRIGRFDPFSYRFANVMIHIFSGVLLFFLILNLCKFLTKKRFFYDHALLIASTTTALFLLHPVQTQTVSYVIQARIEGLGSLFILAVLNAFVLLFALESKLGKALAATVLAMLTVLSCGTKEIVVVIPFLALLADWFFISQEEWSTFKSHLWVHLVFNTFFFIVFRHYMGPHFVKETMSLQATNNNRGNILTDHAFTTITPWTFFISEFRVIVHYITMFIWPFSISVEYDWKMASNFWNSEVIFSFILLLSLGLGALYTTIKKQMSYLAFGFFWFLVCVAPRSTFIPSAELVCDYKTYLASIGILFIGGVLLASLVAKIEEALKDVSFSKTLQKYKYVQREGVAFLLLILMTMPVGFGALMRNKIWESSVSFWADNVKKAPNKARVHNNYGVALSEAGKIDESIAAYKRAIDLDKYYQDPLSNIAVAYSMKGELDQAISSLRAAIHICPNYAEAYNNIGSLLLQKKQFEEAEHALHTALEIRPYYGKAFYNLARMYEEKKQPDKVWEYLKKATEGDLDIPEVFFQFGQMSLQLQKYQEAATAFETVVARGKGDTKTWFNLANAYFMLEDYDKAHGVYERLVRDNPLDEKYSYNLGETLFNKKRYEEAMHVFKKVTTLPRPVPQAFLRVANCLAQLKQFNEAQSFLSHLLTLKIPDDFGKAVKHEMAEIKLQENLIAGNGSIKLSELQQALALRDEKKS